MDEKQKKEYQEYVKQVTPTHNLWLQMLKAFLVGGTICVIGQVILNTCAGMGLDKEASGGWSALILILLSVLLTGFNIYPSIVKWGGAGALVPITGFANSVAAPAIEFKKRDRFSVWAARFSPLQGRLSCLEFSQAGCWGCCTGLAA